MDATRTRRTKDQARQAWYAVNRQRRFARHLGFGPEFGAARGLAEKKCPFCQIRRRGRMGM